MTFASAGRSRSPRAPRPAGAARARRRAGSTALLGALSFAALAVTAACGGGSHTETPANAAPAAAATRQVPVRAVTVEQRDIEETVRVTGALHPRAEVKVIAEVTARLLRVLKDEGSAVRKGELLAQLDDTDYRLAHDRANAALAVADANRAHAAAERDRANSLLKTGGITDKDHLSAQVNLQVAEASVAQAKAEVAIAAQNVARTHIHAPFSGHVADRLADAGAVLASGTPIFSIVDDEVLEFRGAVPSTDFSKIRLNASVSVTVDALPDTALKGTVIRMAPIVQERNRSFSVVARVPGHEHIVGGMFARANIHVRRVPEALLLPPGAVLRDGANPAAGQTFVIVDGKAERREIGIGIEQPDAVQVVSGLKAGDRVVLDPPVSLTSGSTVQIQNATQAKAAPSQP